MTYTIIDENEEQKKYNEVVEHITPQVLGLKPTTDFAEFAQQTIIDDNYEKAKEWINKGAIGVMEAGANFADEFDGTYGNIAPKKESDYAPWQKKGQKVLGEIGNVLNKIYDGKAVYQETLRQTEVQENLQKPHKDNPNYSYKPVAIDRAGRVIYNEVDLRKKIGFQEALAESIGQGKALPFISGVVEGTSAKKFRNIAERIRNNEEIRQDELDYVNHYLDRKNEEYLRGYTTSGEIGKSWLPSMLAFGAEIALGGAVLSKLGLAGKGIAGGVGVGKALLKTGKVSKGIAKGVAYTAGQLMEGGINATVTTAVNPTRLFATYQERRLNDEMKITDRGTVIFQEAKESPAKAFMKSLGQVYISYFAENMGGLIGKPIRGLAGTGAKQFAKVLENNPLLAKFVKKSSPILAKAYEKLNKLPIKGKAVDWIKSQVKFDGFLEELGEEVLEDILNLTVGVDNEERTLENYVKKIVKTPEEWAVLCGVIALQGTTLSLAGNMLGDIMQRNGTPEEKLFEVLQNSTENGRLEILEELAKIGDINIPETALSSDLEIEKGEIEDRVFEKFTAVGEKEDIALAKAKLFGQFFSRYGARNEETKKKFYEWFDKFEVRYDVTPEELQNELIGNVVKKGNIENNLPVINNIGEYKKAINEAKKKIQAEIEKQENIYNDKINHIDNQIAEAKRLLSDINNAVVYIPEYVNKKKRRGHHRRENLKQKRQYENSIKKLEKLLGNFADLVGDSEGSISYDKAVDKFINNKINEKENLIQDFLKFNEQKQDEISKSYSEYRRLKKALKNNKNRKIFNANDVDLQFKSAVRTATEKKYPQSFRQFNYNVVFSVDQKKATKDYKELKINNVDVKFATIFDEMQDDIMIVVPKFSDVKKIKTEISEKIKRIVADEYIELNSNNPNIYYQTGINPKDDIYKRTDKSKYLTDNEVEQLEKDKKNFETFVDKLINGELSHRSQIRVLEHLPSAYDNISELKGKKVVVTQDVYKKIIDLPNKFNKNHNIDRKRALKLPQLISDPLYILQSTSEGNEHRFIVVTNSKGNKPSEKLSIILNPNNNVAVVSAYDEKINISEEKKNNRVLYDKKIELSKTILTSKARAIDNSNNSITNSNANFNPKVYFQTAYHGGAKDFDRFDLSYALTGEGAMAHGYGVYTAKNKEVSEGYRKKLLPPDFANIGMQITVNHGVRDVVYTKKAFDTYSFSEDGIFEKRPDDYLNTALLYIERTSNDKQKAIKQVQEKIDNYRENGDISNARFYFEVKEMLQSYDFDITHNPEGMGQLFEVDIPEDDVLLDEDLPLNKQPEKVKEAILEYYKSRPDDYIVPKDENSLGGQTGKDFYREVVFQMQRENPNDDGLNSKKQASLLLNKYGIKGIKYNGQQDGECYVIFDDKAVDIIKTYYQTGNKEIDESKLYNSLPQDLKEAVDYIFNGEPVYNVSGNEFPNNGENFVDRVTEYYKKNYNSKINIKNFGEVLLDKKSVKNSSHHYFNENKINAFAAVPYVLQQGKIANLQEQYKGKNEDRILFVAPITIKNEEYLCEVVVKATDKYATSGVKRFYLHEVELTKKLADVFQTSLGGTSASSKSIIADLINKLNPNIKNNTFYQEANDDENLIAGFTFQEVLEKAGEIWDKLSSEELDQETRDKLMAYDHILEKAAEISQYPERFRDKEKYHEIMLNAYYIMNNQEIPKDYIETDTISNRSYNDWKKIHEKKKEALEEEYYGYFSETNDKNIITIMANSNSSTALHELGHLFLNGLNELARVDEDARKQLEAVNKWLGYSGEYTIEQQEKFALSFEAYLYRGKAPNNSLRQVFENFKEWLKSVYEHISELVIKGADISDEVTEMFDKMFGADEYYQEKKEVAELLKKVKSLARKEKAQNNIKREEKTLTEDEKRCKQVSYEILSTATGKDINYLKRIFETSSNKNGYAKRRENIEMLLDKVEDQNAISGGMRNEWKEFYNYTDEIGGDYELAWRAYQRIIDKDYGGLSEKYDNEMTARAEFFERAIDNAQRQYRFLIRSFKNGNRNVALAAMYEWLGGLNYEIKQDFEDRFIFDSAIIERDEKVNKFDKAKREILSKALELENKYAINKDEKYKELVKEIMKKLNFLQPSDKAKLTANILDVPSVEFLMASIDNIMDIAKTMEDVNLRNNLSRRIHAELQGTKNVKKNGRSVGKYDYRSNKLFEELRRFDRMSAEEANEIRLEAGKFAAIEDNGLSKIDKLKMKFLSYKAGGRNFADTELLKELYEEIVNIKLAGKSAKSELELMEKISEEKDIEELINIVENKKEAILALKAYVNGIGNLESTLNAIFNKKIANKYGAELLYAETNAQAFQYEQKTKFEKAVAKIYNLPEWCWDKKVLDYLGEKHTFPEIRRKYDTEGKLVKTRQVNRTLTKMDVIGAYIWSKNGILEKRLINQFGKNTLENMFELLSEEDKKFAQLMMSTAQSFYPLVNKAFIKKYGVDLPRVSCYFPSTPERGCEVELYNDYSSKALGNSFTKARAQSEILPMDFHNPVAILYSHIDGVAKFAFMSEALDNINLRFKDGDLKRVIINKYGEDTYRTLEQILLNVTYKKEAQVFSGFNKVVDQLVTNWVSTNVAIKPIVGLKQLLAANNYAVDMPYMEWQAGFLNCLAHPKETINYMMKIPYLKARFGGSMTNEFLKQTIENSAFAASKKLKDLCALFIKVGDVGAIVFGGKPYIDHLIKEGMSEEEAIKQFVLFTNRTQQSSAISSLSNMQVNLGRKPFEKLFIAYKNSPLQYIRMCGDALVAVSNGEMTKKQCAKTIFQFAYVQPFLYAVATSGSLFRFLFAGDDDDLKKDLTSSIFNLNADGVPFLGDIYKYAMDRIVYKEKGMVQTTPLIGDIEKEIAKLAKEDLDVGDYLKSIAYLLIQLGLGYNTNALFTMGSGVGDVFTGEGAQGALKMLGYTDYRAKHITGKK